jgi:hypothetical protein
MVPNRLSDLMSKNKYDRSRTLLDRKLLGGHSSKYGSDVEGDTQNMRNNHDNVPRGGRYGQLDEEGRDYQERMRDRDPHAKSLSEISGNEDEYYYIDRAPEYNNAKQKTWELAENIKMDEITDKFKSISEKSILDMMNKSLK